MNRATGLLLIEVVNSNPNGNPDQESDPRLRPDERGMISPVSFKRKLRDLIEDKEGPVWEAHRPVSTRCWNRRIQILESRGRDRNEIKALDAKEFVAATGTGVFLGIPFLRRVPPPRSVLVWSNSAWAYRSPL